MPCRSKDAASRQVQKKTAGHELMAVATPEQVTLTWGSIVSSICMVLLEHLLAIAFGALHGGRCPDGGGRIIRTVVKLRIVFLVVRGH